MKAVKKTDRKEKRRKKREEIEKNMEKHDYTKESYLGTARIRSLRKRSEKAFDSGEIEKAKKLAAKADKAAKFHDKIRDGIDRYVAQQQAVEEKHRKMRERSGFGGIEAHMAQVRAEQDRIIAASRGGDPSTAQTPSMQTPKPKASTTKKSR